MPGTWEATGWPAVTPDVAPVCKPAPAPAQGKTQKCVKTPTVVLFEAPLVHPSIDNPVPSRTQMKGQIKMDERERRFNHDVTTRTHHISAAGKMALSQEGRTTNMIGRHSTRRLGVFCRPRLKWCYSPDVEQTGRDTAALTPTPLGKNELTSTISMQKSH